MITVAEIEEIKALIRQAEPHYRLHQVAGIMLAEARDLANSITWTDDLSDRRDLEKRERRLRAWLEATTRPPKAADPLTGRVETRVAS